MKKESEKQIDFVVDWLKDKYTKYELARLLGSRALQLSMGAPCVIKLSKKDLEKLNYNTLDIARKEIEADMLPISIRRPKPGEILL